MWRKSLRDAKIILTGNMQVQDCIVHYTRFRDMMRMWWIFPSIPYLKCASTPRLHTSCMTRLHLMETHCWTSLCKSEPLCWNVLIDKINGFMHTWIPEDADKLIIGNLNKKHRWYDGYPVVSVIHNCCVSMCKSLEHQHQTMDSRLTYDHWQWLIFGRHWRRAKLLGWLPLHPQKQSCLVKKKWQQTHKAAGKDYFHPSIVFGSNAQVALENFTR